MRYFLKILFAALLLAAPAAPVYAQAISATVVSACGTPPGTYVAGQSRPVTQNTTGLTCTSSGGAGATIQTVTGTTGGANTISLKVPNNTTSVAICAAACTLYGFYVQNNSAVIAYLKLYNASQASTTCGSGTPIDRIMIPSGTVGAGATVSIAGSAGAAYGTALTACVTTGYADTDTTAPAASAYLISLYTK